MDKKIVLTILTFLSFLLSIPLTAAQEIIADHTIVADFESIPTSVIEQIKTGYSIFYGHTSHGSQIITGMDMIRSENSLYDYNNGTGTLTIAEYGDDLGAEGDTTWVPITRQRLNQPGNNINIVIWSWCGGVSSTSEEGMNIYLNAMNGLENDYPNVIFIYMTGHLDGSGPEENLYLRNNQIRNYCLNNGKVLFDFADIESYAPDGTYYPYETDACNWCSDWCASHTCPDCGGCAHSHCFNCYQKGKAFWWMMATIDGWNIVPESCGDADGNGKVNLLDVSFIINYLYRAGTAPDPIWKADPNADGKINLLDVSYLINYLYRSGPDPICP
jgi:hypothetical protein